MDSRNPHDQIRVLVVDDEASAVGLLRQAIEMEGYKVASAQSVDQAIEATHSFKPHIVVTDWNMKESRDGIDIAREALANDPSTSIIFVTALPNALCNRIPPPVVDNVIPKPIELDELFTALDSAAEKHPVAQ